MKKVLLLTMLSIILVLALFACMENSPAEGELSSAESDPNHSQISISESSFTENDFSLKSNSSYGETSSTDRKSVV